MHPTITCKLKSNEKFQDSYNPKIMILVIFVPKIYAWLASPINLLQKQSLWICKEFNDF